MPKVQQVERLFVLDVNQKTKGRLGLSAVQRVKQLPPKLGIDQVAGKARVGLRLGPLGEVEVIGLDRIIRKAPIGKEGRC